MYITTTGSPVGMHSCGMTRIQHKLWITGRIKGKAKKIVFTFNESLFQSDVLTFYQACVRKMILRQRTEPESKLK